MPKYSMSEGPEDAYYYGSNPMEEGGTTAVYGENNGMSVLSVEDVIDIRKRLLNKLNSATELAKEFGVSKTAIQCIKHNRTWRGVGKEYCLPPHAENK